jgi:membrane protein DedA with SNARE-associated domain
MSAEAKTPEPETKIARATAAVAATGALACGVCCVLPFAPPAAALAISGGILAWFGSLRPWTTVAAVVAVAGAGCGWCFKPIARDGARLARQCSL